MAAKKQAWNVPEKEFPKDGTDAEKLAFCVRYAMLAPSVYNSQPWRFRVTDKAVELIADRRRGLPVADAGDRQLTVFCGTALYFLRTAMAYFGMKDKTELLPGGEEKEGDLLARISIDGTHEPGELDKKLFKAISTRRTNRATYDDTPVPDEIITRMQDAVREEGGWFHSCSDTEKNVICNLMAEADRLQMAQKPFRRELAAWLTPQRKQSGDGLPDDNFDFNKFMSSFEPVMARRFDGGDFKPVQDAQIANGCPLLGVLGTKGGGTLKHLHVGQALGRLLLVAESEGIRASYLNQPVEVPEIRLRLHDAIEHIGRAQMIVRMGYGPTVKPNNRRPLSEVLVNDSKSSGGALEHSTPGTSNEGGFFKKLGRLFLAK